MREFYRPRRGKGKQIVGCLASQFRKRVAHLRRAEGWASHPRLEKDHLDRIFDRIHPLHDARRFRLWLCSPPFHGPITRIFPARSRDTDSETANPCPKGRLAHRSLGPAGQGQHAQGPDGVCGGLGDFRERTMWSTVLTAKATVSLSMLRTTSSARGPPSPRRTQPDEGTAFIVGGV